MTEELWYDVDEYYENLLVKPDARYSEIVKNSLGAGLPEIQVSSLQGKFLSLLIKSLRARRVLEIGTLGGYSSAWMASTLPADGVLVTLELEQGYADVARANLERFPFGNKVDIRVGDATSTLQELVNASAEPFDLIFLDADKTQYTEYLKHAVSLSRIGTLIIADNVVREGEVINEQTEDPMALGIRAFNHAVASDERLSSTVLQTVGAKGHDGFACVVVESL